MSIYCFVGTLRLFLDVQVRDKENGSAEDEDEGYRIRSRSVHYLASQYLADSSLSMDVSQFDFTSTPASVSKTP